MISTKSRNYTQAFFEAVPELEALSQLKALASLFSQEEIKSFFLSFTVPKEDKKELLNKALQSVSPPLKNFFHILLDSHSFALLPQITLACRELEEEKEGVCRGEIFSPAPSSAESKESLEALLSRFFDKKAQLSWTEDKTLIGGFRVQLGGHIFNRSVKHYLERFKRGGG